MASVQGTMKLGIFSLEKRQLREDKIPHSIFTNSSKTSRTYQMKQIRARLEKR